MPNGGSPFGISMVFSYYRLNLWHNYGVIGGVIFGFVNFYDGYGFHWASLLF